MTQADADANPDAAPSRAPRLAPGTRALVTGATGQDGYYLSRLLAAQGCQVVGAVRPAAPAAESANPAPDIELLPFDLADPDSVDSLVDRARPDVIFHLAAQSSVKISWEDPVATARANAMGTLHLLEAVRRLAPAARLVVAGSCDSFDHAAAGRGGVTPDTPPLATNPYAATKVMAHQLVRCYREHYGLRAAVAILFNHTSPRRSPIFVERGIVRQAVLVALGRADAVAIGAWDTRRDWSWAEDIVDGLARLGALAEPVDLVLASGRTLTVADWVDESFRQLGLDRDRHVRVDPTRLHPGDRPHAHGNITLARDRLGWRPTTSLPEMIRRLIAHDRADLAGQAVAGVE